MRNESEVRNYWKWLKNKLKEEGSNLFSNQQSDDVVSNTNHLTVKNELVSNTNQLKKENEPVTNCYQLKAKNESLTSVTVAQLIALPNFYLI